MKTQRDQSDGSMWPVSPWRALALELSLPPSGTGRGYLSVALSFPACGALLRGSQETQAREAGEKASCAPLRGAQGAPWTCPSPLASVPKSLSHSFLNTCRLSGPAVPPECPGWGRGTAWGGKGK